MASTDITTNTQNLELPDSQLSEIPYSFITHLQTQEIMEELINQASQIIQQSSNLLSHPVIGTAVTGLTSWIGGILGKPSAKEKIKQIEENNYTEETVTGLEANLQYILEDNKSLQEELAAKLKAFEELMAKEGVAMPTKTNTQNITGDGNIAFQDVNSKGDISITK